MAASKVTKALLSTKYWQSNEGKLSVKALRERFKGAKDVRIASAFYDTKFLTALFSRSGKEMAKLRSIRLLFNGLGGRRLDLQRVELKKLRTALRKGGREVEIRLAFESGLFHSKLILGEVRGKRIALLGSANATMAAMKVNEEILLQPTTQVGVLWSYFDRVWAKAKDLDEVEPAKARSLIAFFRSGSLYFKPQVSLQTTLNPFVELMSQLTQRDRNKLVDIDIPFADPRPSMSPFDLKLAAGVRRNVDGDGSSKARASIKPYCVETCLGYWVPKVYERSVEKQADKVKKSKEPQLALLLSALKKAGKATVLSNYLKYMKASRTRFSEIDLEPYLDDLSVNPFIDTQRIESYYNRTRRNLEREEYRDRLCSPFVRAPMPEIWDDPLMREEFEQSFFEYLEYIAGKSGKGNKVPNRIQWWCKYGPGNSWKDIRRILGKGLQNAGWAEDEW